MLINHLSIIYQFLIYICIDQLAIIEVYNLLVSSNRMQSVVRHSNKSIEEYRHNIKLLKYHLKQEQKVNQTLKYKDYKRHRKDNISKISKVQQKHQIYSLIYTVNQLNRRTKEMGMVLGDVFRMADYSYEGEISKEQFMKTILKLKAGIDQGTVNEMFYAIDTDFNNNLSQDQYNQFLYAHGGCENKDALKYQKRSAQKLAAQFKKKTVKVSDFLNRMVDPCPAQEILSKLKDQKLDKNQCMILLKLWDPSLKGEVRHEVYLKSMQNVKQKDEAQIQNEKFEKGVQELCVILRDRKLNPIIIFEQAEADGKPGISQFQLQQGLRKLMPEQTGYQIRKWVNMINLNGDTQITREEFVSAMRSFYSIQQIQKYSNEYQKLHPQLKRALNNEQIPSQKIINQLSIAIEDSGRTKAEAFHKIDINHNGLMDKQELHEGLKDMGINIGLIAKVLTVFDRDASGEISMDEWLNILGEDVQMEDADAPPPPTKKSKKTGKTPKVQKTTPQPAVVVDKEVSKVEQKSSKVKQPVKKVPVNKTVETKKTEPLKSQDKNKTVKQADKPSSKKPQPKKQAAFAEDDMMDSKTEVKDNFQPEQEQVNSEPLEREVAEKYATSKTKVLASFKSIVRNKEGISQRELLKCLGELQLKQNLDDKVLQSIFQSNIASNGTFQYVVWLEELPSKYQIDVVVEKEPVKPEKKVTPQEKEAVKPEPKERVKPQPQEEPKTESVDKAESKKRGQDHEMFQCLTDLVVKNQQHTQTGYRFADYISDTDQLSLLKNKYLPFAQKLKNNPKTFKDSSFPTKLSSLTDTNPAKSNIGNVSLLKWKHYSEIFQQPKLFDKGIEPNDIRQGELGDCYFLCSLASLGEYKNLVQRLFEYIDMENGYFLVWLCLDGKWKLIELDGYIPVKPDGSRLVFSHCKEGDDQLWVILLEKAYAKAYGNYEHIVGGQPYQAIKDLTGAPGKSFAHKNKDINPDILWPQLQRANKQKFMMTCGTDDSQKGNIKIGDHSQSVTTQGIVIGHAYSILDVASYKGQRLIQVRNPWGTTQWNGRWSDQANQWTPDARNKLNYAEGKDDGIFWMPYEAFYQKYATTAINYIRPNYYYHSEQRINIKHLIVKIRASDLQHGFIMVAQNDHRTKGMPDNTPYNVCHFLGANYNGNNCLKIISDEKYRYQREGCVQIDSSKVDSQSDFVILINLQEATDITLCSYSDRKFKYQCNDRFETMLEFIEGIAVMEEGAKNVSTDGSGSFKCWLASVGEYAFQVFKNIKNTEIKLKIELTQPKNLSIIGDLKRTITLRPGEADTIQAKIIDLKNPYGLGPMRFGMV